MAGKTNTETGKVVKINGDKATVRFEKTSACSHCDHKYSCSSEGNDYMFVELENTIDAKVGETVEVAASMKSTYKNGFIVYILPLIVVLISAGIGNAFDKKLGTGFITPVTAVSSIVLYFSILHLIYKNKKSELVLGRAGRKNVQGCSHCG